MCTGNSWTVKSCSTVHTARLLQARELWRRMLKYSTYPIQLGTIMEAHRELRWGKLILIDTNRETVWRKQCISAKNAHFGTRYTMWWEGTSTGNIFSILSHHILVWFLSHLWKMVLVLLLATTSSVKDASLPLVPMRLWSSMLLSTMSALVPK